MTVYVDSARNIFGRMKMSHMIADDLNELHAMADKIGLKRIHFQNNPRHPHYDVSQVKRSLAIKHGAVEIGSRDLIKLLRSWRL